MRILFIVIILFVNILIQTSILPNITVLQFKPDTLLAVVVSFALLDGSLEGSLVGLCGGLLQDFILGKTVGFYALIYMIIGYIVGLLHKRVYTDIVFIPMLFSFLAYILKEFMVIVLLFVFKTKVPVYSLIFDEILPCALSTCIFVFFAYYIIWKIHKSKFMIKKWSFKHQ